MKSKILLVFIVILLLNVLLVNGLMIDDFNDASLNTTLWTTRNVVSATEAGGNVSIVGASGGTPNTYGCIYGRNNTLGNTTMMNKTLIFKFTNTGTSNYMSVGFSIEPLDCIRETTNHYMARIDWRESAVNPDIILHTNNGTAGESVNLYEGATFGTYYIGELTLQANGTIRAVLRNNTNTVLANVSGSQVFPNYNYSIIINDWGGNAGKDTVDEVYFADTNVTSNVTDQCTYSGSGNWNITNTICNITVNTNVLTNNLTITNSTVIINATITNYTIYLLNSGSIVTRKTN